VADKKKGGAAEVLKKKRSGEVEGFSLYFLEVGGYSR